MSEFTYRERRNVVDGVDKIKRTTTDIEKKTDVLRDETGKILRRLDQQDALLEAVLKEMRGMSRQLTQRMDDLEQALVDPKSDAARKLGLKYTSSKKKQIIP